MKNYLISFAILLAGCAIIFSGCAKQTTEDPCNGIGTFNILNKLDSTINVEIVQTHKTIDILKDYTLPFHVAGNQPYEIKIIGPQYYKDTTLMILNCDNIQYIVIK